MHAEIRVPAGRPTVRIAESPLETSTAGTETVVWIEGLHAAFGLSADDTRDLLAELIAVVNVLDARAVLTADTEGGDR